MQQIFNFGSILVHIFILDLDLPKISLIDTLVSKNINKNSDEFQHSLGEFHSSQSLIFAFGGHFGVTGKLL